MVSRKNWSQETCLSDRTILIRMGYRRHKLCLRWRDSICADMIPNHISFLYKKRGEMKMGKVIAKRFIFMIPVVLAVTFIILY